MTKDELVNFATSIGVDIECQSMYSPDGLAHIFYGVVSAAIKKERDDIASLINELHLFSGSEYHTHPEIRVVLNKVARIIKNKNIFDLQKSIDAQIEILKQKSDECSEQNSDKMYFNNRAQKQLDELESERVFLNYDIRVEVYGQGTLLINNKYIFSTKSYKWRRNGRSTWYRSAGPEDFLERFVKVKPVFKFKHYDQRNSPQATESN